MLTDAYLLAKIGADRAENEQHFDEILPKIGNYPTGPKFFSGGSTDTLASRRRGTVVNGTFLSLVRGYRGRFRAERSC